MLNSINRVLDKPDFGKLLLRVSFSILMLFHGWHKLHSGIGGVQKMLVEAGIPTFVGYGVYVGEVIIPILLILGIFTRPAALIFSFTMLTAALLANPNDLFVLTKTGAWIAEPAAVFFFAGLAIAFLGSGRYSVISNPRWR
ncbi:DoxX family protein [Brenneria tiliae]|uniref:DoxX family protein n=1 Tax=Brenneria tiliae TaxID=2914984 RepID=A0ABT0MRQ6_9GAMM|nr:DoxX family protein [Brenneria tiliae]MCL2892539.1 DoxX family protein [Brenneria tiliae]